MVLRFCLYFSLLLLFACAADFERDHPYDPDGVNYVGGYMPGSSSSAPPPISYGTLTYEGQNYKTVKIGEQVWMAENLNYDVPDNATDVCYENVQVNCATYGRLYNWATAMGLDPSCNSTSCASQVQEKHQGICPDGWHVPSDADWDQLYRYADGTAGTSSPYNSRTASKYLKTTSGWSNCGPSGSSNSYVCSDTYGFSALPGGDGNSGGGFGNVGNSGFWWSASEYDSYGAHLRVMYYYDEYARWLRYSKTLLFSLRCLQDSP